MISFLHSEEIFENHFYKFINGEKKKNRPFSAMEFYKKVRCGLMHEAQTKGEWIVNAKKTYQDDDVIFITKDSEKNKISIDRNILQKQLKIYFQDYLFNLSQESPEGNQLRRFLARKLDHFLDISADSNYDWWDDH